MRALQPGPFGPPLRLEVVLSLVYLLVFTCGGTFFVLSSEVIVLPDGSLQALISREVFWTLSGLHLGLGALLALGALRARRSGIGTQRGQFVGLGMAAATLIAAQVALVVATQLP